MALTILSSWPGKGAKRVFTSEVPVIHVFLLRIIQDVDARDKRGHDKEELFLRLERPSQQTFDCGIDGDLAGEDRSHRI